MIDLKKIRVHDTLLVSIKKDTPYLSELLKDRRRIAIYYEQSYHESINRYIRLHYNDIFDHYYSNGIVFIYFPMILENMDSLLQFNFPDSNAVNNKSISAEDFYNALSENIIDNPSTGRPMLLVNDHVQSRKLKQEDIEVACFNGYDLDYADDHQFSYAIRHYLPPFRIRHSDTLFRLGDDDVPCVREEGELFGYDADKASIEIFSKEILERIDHLHAMGVLETLLKQILILPESGISRLVITDDFRILLPDYGNREIKISKLPKSLYFFYLRHVTGVRFKELRDHRDEIFDIYCTISPRENIEGIMRSIDDIVDSTKNSVNEKCSRIKEAFASQIKDGLASQYYITGRAGEPKRIVLNRSLVEDQSGLIMK